MSLDTLVATIEDIVQTEEAEADTTEVVEAVIPSAIELVVPEAKVTKKKGRPQVHSKEGRVYFLRNEVEEIRKDPQAFMDWMHDTYAIADSRYTELANNKVIIEPEELAYTLHGEILEVLSQAEAIVKMHPGKEISFEISKQKLVAPTHANYIKPVMEKVTINGKPFDSITFQEFNPNIIYVYLTIR